MKSAAIPNNERDRLSVLYEYNILDTLPEKEFDDITRIASEVCGTSISLVSIIDEHRQWFKSTYGISAQETPREVAFCSHAILNPDEIFVVPDSSKDERFADNPYVIGEPNVMFYAGIPLVSESGFALGTICVIDNKPRELTQHQKDTLRALGNQVVCLLELHRKTIELEKKQAQLVEINAELEKFVYAAAHDFKSPCNNIIALSEILERRYADCIGNEGKEIVQDINRSSINLKQMVDGVLQHSRIVHFIDEKKQEFTFSELMDEVKSMIITPDDFIIYYHESNCIIYSVRSAMVQIILNLCYNAIAYNDKSMGYVRINFEEDSRNYRFVVTDNGMGIPEKEHARIFELFTTVNPESAKGNGIGLNTVQKLVKKLNGNIRISSEIGVGSSFSIALKK